MISDLNEISMITSCDGEKQNIFIKEIQPSEFSEMVSSGVELIIIDVREEWEREISKISPSVHIPLGNFLLLKYHQFSINTPQKVRLLFIAKLVSGVELLVKYYKNTALLIFIISLVELINGRRKVSR